MGDIVIYLIVAVCFIFYMIHWWNTNKKKGIEEKLEQKLVECFEKSKRFIELRNSSVSKEKICNAESEMKDSVDAVKRLEEQAVSTQTKEGLSLFF